MAKPEWGTKRICPNCGARYYDMRRTPPVCPVCNTPFDPEALLKSRRTRAPLPEEPKQAPAVVEEDLEAEVPEEEEEEAEEEEEIEEAVVEEVEDEDEAVIEDASDLGDDDMNEVVDLDSETEEDR